MTAVVSEYEDFKRAEKVREHWLAEGVANGHPSEDMRGYFDALTICWPVHGRPPARLDGGTLFYTT